MRYNPMMVVAAAAAALVINKTRQDGII